MGFACKRVIGTVARSTRNEKIICQFQINHASHLKDFFSKCDQIRRELCICSYLIGTFFLAVLGENDEAVFVNFKDQEI